MYCDEKVSEIELTNNLNPAPTLTVFMSLLVKFAKPCAKVQRASTEPMRMRNMMTGTREYFEWEHFATHRMLQKTHSQTMPQQATYLLEIWLCRSI